MSPRRKKRRKKIITILLIIIFILSITPITGCSKEEIKQLDEVKNSNPIENKTMQIGVYFVKNTHYGSYLVREIYNIPCTDEPLKAAIEQLIHTKPKTEGAINVIPKDTEVLSVTAENGLATIDFSKEVLHANTGAQMEALGILSIVNTLTEFPDVEKVSFKVEGNTNPKTMDWWGHVGLYEQPFNKDLIPVYEPAIWITHPQPEQVVCVPMLVKGSARVWEGKITVRLIDSDNNVLVEENTITDNPNERSDFEISLKFDLPRTTGSVLEISGTNINDSSKQDKILVPIQWP